MAVATVLDDMDPAGPGPQPPTPDDHRRAGWAGEQWINDSFADIYRQLAALQSIKRDKRQPKVFLQMPREVLDAFDRGIVDKAEVRRIMGLPTLRKRKQPPQLARAQAARRRQT